MGMAYTGSVSYNFNNNTGFGIRTGFVDNYQLQSRVMISTSNFTGLTVPINYVPYNLAHPMQTANPIYTYAYKDSNNNYTTYILWKENIAKVDNTDSSKKPNIGDAWKVMLADKKIMLVGAVQALFEGAMYIFVLQWPPALKSSIFASKFGPNAAVPFGKVFSCFMACCLLGSSAFGAIVSRGIAVETMTTIMLGLATVAMTLATITGTNGLGLLIAAFFLFEACVGMYFPSIGSLRAKYIPDKYRSVIMNLFGIPLNLIVVSK
jgi:hypothetical protein